MDLQKLSDGKLAALVPAIEEEVARRRKVKAEKLQKAILAQINNEGFEVEEIFSTASKKKKAGKKRPYKKVAIKYRNREDSSQTWTGRGRTPVWVREQLAEGASLEDFRV